MHAIINDLPDSNYATLRALVLHLERVKAHEGSNRFVGQFYPNHFSAIMLNYIPQDGYQQLEYLLCPNAHG